MSKFSRIVLILALSMSGLHAREVVVLLHGLARSPASMEKLEHALSGEGYVVFNIGYPSTQLPVEELARLVHDKIEHLCGDADRVHFVTHSMGGIVLRYIQKHFPVENIGRSVMLSPPNKGSEVVDAFSGWQVFNWINGPAGMQLGTGENSIPNSLGPAGFELGIITGDRSINWILSLIIPGKDDGKVSLEHAAVEGMDSFKVVHATHPFIMNRSAVIHDVISFLRKGEFSTPAG